MITILMIGCLLSLTGFITIIIGKHEIIWFALMVPFMIIIDGIIIYGHAVLGAEDLNIMTGIMLGTLTKIIIFLLYEGN